MQEENVVYAAKSPKKIKRLLQPKGPAQSQLLVSVAR